MKIKVQPNYLNIALILIFAVWSTYSINVEEYDKKWSKTLNCYSAITHCTQSQILNWSCKICKQVSKLTNISYIDNTLYNVIGYIGYQQSQDAIMIVLRGTKDIRNWIQDFDYRLTMYDSCKGCLIHQGFYFDYLAIKTQVQYSIKNLMSIHPNAKIIVTGSSLGGALATVAAIQLQTLTGKVQQLHAFGCPRVGNANFAQYLALKIPTIYRVIHNKDIVPHVPLISQNFHHPAFEILYDQQMSEYKKCDNSGQDTTCSNSYYPNFSIPDHTSYWYKPVQQNVCA